jgi:subtilisin family serine protease
MKKFFTLLLSLLVAVNIGAVKQLDTKKLSPGVISICNRANSTKVNATGGKPCGKKFMALMSLKGSNYNSSILKAYNVEVIDSVGRIYIVRLPVESVGALSMDPRIERIEAESVPRPAMDVTPGQINATPVYEGGTGGASYIVEDVNRDGHITSADVTSIYDYLLNGTSAYLNTSDVNCDGAVTSADVTLLYNILLGNAQPTHAGGGLPQAFTGSGVAAGIFDNGFDFTHPAFLDANGNSRAQYYYDFCWQNDDGTLGHAMTSPEEILAYGHTHHAGATLHGTHVMGIMAGSAVNGKYQGMAPGSDLYVAHFNSRESDFENPDEMTSAVCVLGFKYIFDQAQEAGKPCVVNFSSGESCTFAHERILEGEAMQSLTGPGRIIVACAGNDGYHTAYMEKPADVLQAGTAIVNGVGGGNIIDLDIVTPVNQRVRLDFLSIRLVDTYIEKTLIFNTDSVLALQDTCRLETTVMLGDIHLKIWKSNHYDERGDVFHVHGDMPNLAYLILCGTLVLFTGDGPAWVYSDIKFCPFVNVDGIEAYSYGSSGHSMWWPGTLPGIITVGATGYKSTFVNIDGQTNDEIGDLAASAPGLIARFSSKGPTFDGLTKPDVCAPGVSINAAFNGYVEMTDKVRAELTDKVTYNGKDYYYTAQSGTSMSTPVVAGTIALWLEANPNLTTEDIIDVFEHTCTHPEPSMTYPNNIYGYGQVDVYRGLLYILGIPDRIEELSNHQPLKASFRIDERVLSVVCDVKSAQKAQLTVYSLDGNLVAAANGTTVDLSALESGVYAVQLNTGIKETTGSTLIRL